MSSLRLLAQVVSALFLVLTRRAHRRSRRQSRSARGVRAFSSSATRRGTLSAFRRSNHTLTYSLRSRPRPGPLCQRTQSIQTTLCCPCSAYHSSLIWNRDFVGLGCPHRKREEFHLTCCAQTPSSPCRPRSRPRRIRHFRANESRGRGHQARRYLG